MRLGGWERSSRGAETVALVDTGCTVSISEGGPTLPLLISPAVDERFGATAVLGIPECDRTDELIAERLGLPLVVVEEEEGVGGNVDAGPIGTGSNVRPAEVTPGGPGAQPKPGDTSLRPIRETLAALASPNRPAIPVSAGGALQGQRLLDLPPALVGHADPDRVLRWLRNGADPQASSCRWSCRSI